ncbi:MAG: hypothetical protein HY929_08560 [Euryarchaeota archaeon]|nr:hypothetical protein [Euryarchaeota archaeon]
MTTLVALSTKDALVLGCDSLGSRTRRVIDPGDLIDFFNLDDKEFPLKLDKDGKPLLKSFNEVYLRSVSTPVEHMTHMAKLFLLEPLKIGIMLTGITSIGERTIKSLVEEFKTKKIKLIKSKSYTVKDIAEKILEHILLYYEKEYPDEKSRPELELILGGYGKKEVLPEIYRIKLPVKNIELQLGSQGESRFGIVFGGQMKEIQRIVFGTDYGNTLELRKRHIELLKKYREKIMELLKSNSITFQIPEFSKDELSELDIFTKDWKLEGFEANWGDFSEQNAIECVDFFVNIMIKSQQFGGGMPTVGGEVHIALITKDKARFVSKEEYYHSGHFTPKHIQEAV